MCQYVQVLDGFRAGRIGWWLRCLPTGLTVVTLRIRVKACWRDGNPDNMFRMLDDGLNDI